ncbi:hypothetical protein FSP39_012789 [Pinctada imbricata]|uniref:Uncharacterized protein n=1 Tax=Pinctada imbricata TaxID=66713 RepID=A0AA88YAN1_PINIB|nr:hypothetical protein FSP39_012789 [Pinctada imbricata]
MESTIKYVIAIDIGTSYSGYAFNDNVENQRDPLSITLKSWQGGSNLSMKAPTVILFDKERNFHSFGNVAAKAYATALQKGEQSRYICVKGFKMNLYHEKKVSEDLLLEDTEGHTVDAMMVFTESIKSLKNDALADIRKRLSEIDEDQVTYVLTVPAIWREPAKQFMRLAAEKGGIKSESLTIALESEVAALYCRHLELGTVFGSGDKAIKRCFQPGGKYIIMDLGGGTVDTVVHTIDGKGDMIELFKSSGGPWGGEYVNANFRKFIEATFGKEAAIKFKETRPVDNFDLEQEFERKKRDLNTENDSVVRLKVPNRLKIFANKQIEKNTVDNLYIEYEQFTSFFDPLIDKMIQHFKSISEEVGQIPLLILVGGFSESVYVQERVMQGLQNVKVLVPRESGLAVLKGAVLFGFNPGAVKMRRCRFTYGIGVRDPFDESIHPEEKLIIVENEKRCKDVFKILVHEGENVEFDQVTESYLHSPHASKERKNIQVTFPIYSSSRRNPSFVTDQGCSKLGEIILKPPENGWPALNKYTVKCKFGRTEIFVNVHDTTNDRKYDSTFDMLG